MKKQIITLCLIAFFIPTALFAAGSEIGMMRSVGVSGAFDAVRNPALLSYQKSTNNLSMMAKYIPFYNEDESLTIDDSFIDEKMDISKDRRYTGTLGMAYARSNNMKGFGIALTSHEFEMVEYMESTEKFTHSIGFINTDRRQFRVSPQLTLGWSGKAGEKSSWGVATSYLYQYEMTVMDQDTNINDGVAKFHSNSAGMSLVFGYFMRGDSTDVGLTFSTGSWMVHWLSAHSDNTTAGTVTNNEKKWLFDADDPMAITTGIEYRLTKAVRFYLDLHYYFPGRGSTWSNDYDASSGNISLNRNTISTKDSFFIASGVEFDIGSSVKTALGGSIINREKDSGSNLKSDYTVMVADLGFKYFWDEASYFAVTTRMMYYDVSQEYSDTSVSREYAMKKYDYSIMMGFNNGF